MLLVPQHINNYWKLNTKGARETSIGRRGGEIKLSYWGYPCEDPLDYRKSLTQLSSTSERKKISEWKCIFFFFYRSLYEQSWERENARSLGICAFSFRSPDEQTTHCLQYKGIVCLISVATIDQSQRTSSCATADQVYITSRLLTLVSSSFAGKKTLKLDWYFRVFCEV